MEDITVYAISGTSATSIAIGSVKHSQRLSSTPCKSWIAARNEGTILCAHCTCMAGLGEACSHIGAILFTLDKNTQYQKTTTCTSLPCSWLPPTFQNVPYSELAMISFATPQHKRCRSEKGTEDTSPQAKKQATKRIQIPSAEELETFYSRLSKSGMPVLLSLVPGYSEKYIPLCVKGVIPHPLTDLFNKENLNLSHDDLLLICEEVFNTYKITQDVAKCIEEQTRE